ncbi:MAG: hypothetical protein R2807_02400 [Chitinophagales bacterium]
MEEFIVKVGRKIHEKFKPISRKIPETDFYFDKPIATVEGGNQYIHDLLETGKPCMITRIGSTELWCLKNALEIEELKQDASLIRIWKRIQGKYNTWQHYTGYAMHRYSGFFPNTPQDLEKFSLLYFSELPKADILGVWYNYYEDIVCDKYCKHAQLIRLRSIEPYYSAQPWSKQLAGKKVLVIHPFEKTIQHQYAKQSLLFTNPDILPAFELKTIKAVQSAAFNDSGFSSWFEALESMKKQMQQTDFDIALIGAGAYGLPLAAYAKDLGKQAIHFGGSLQILFGIKGARWDDNPQINQFYNEHWVRPFPEDTPDGYKKVEDGCYW